MMHIFHRLANDIWTRTKSWIMSSFKDHSPNEFFLNSICFHVFHNVWFKISTIFMMLETFSWADLFSRLLCWSMYWLIMWFLCDFEYIAKNRHRVYIAAVTGIYVGSQGKVREFFSANPVAALFDGTEAYHKCFCEKFRFIWRIYSFSKKPCYG